MIQLNDIQTAATRLQGQLLRTPCVASRPLSDITGAQVFLKFENLQFTASFKERGACNKLAQLSAEERRRGVIAMSAGNHAQGVAYHAQRLGLRAVIVMPRFTPGVKVERTRGFRAEIVLHGDTLDEARAHALALAEQQQLIFVHPYERCGPSWPVKARSRWKMLQDVPDLDTLVVVRVGGGGLIAGMATAAKAIQARYRDSLACRLRRVSRPCSMPSKARTTRRAAAVLPKGIAVGTPGKIPKAIIRPAGE